MESTSVVSQEEILSVAEVSTWDPESDEFFPFVLQTDAETTDDCPMQPQEAAPDYLAETAVSRRKFKNAGLMMYKTKYLDYRHAITTMKQLLPIWEAALQYDRQLFEKGIPFQYPEIKEQMGKFRKNRKIIGGAIIEYVSCHQNLLSPAGKAGFEKFKNCLNQEMGLADEILLEEEFQAENSRFISAEDFLRKHPEYFF